MASYTATLSALTKPNKHSNALQKAGWRNANAAERASGMTWVLRTSYRKKARPGPKAAAVWPSTTITRGNDDNRSNENHLIVATGPKDTGEDPAIEDMGGEEPIGAFEDEEPIDLGVLRCGGCTRTFKTAGALSTHRLHCKILNRHTCTVCEEVFVSKAALDGHKRIHMPRRPPTRTPPKTHKPSNPTLRKPRASRGDMCALHQADNQLEHAVQEVVGADKLSHDLGLDSSVAKEALMRARAASDGCYGLSAHNIAETIEDNQQLWSDTWQVLLQKLQGAALGRGMNTKLKGGSLGSYRSAMQVLFTAGVAAKIVDVKELIADLCADHSQTRPVIIKALTESSLSPHYTRGFLMRIRRLVECAAPDSSIAIDEMKAAESKLKVKIQKGKKTRDAIDELRTIGDLLHQDPAAALPKGFDKKAAPSMDARIQVHKKLMQTTMAKLRKIPAINIKARSHRDVIFDCAFLMSLSIPPQRTSAWREALYGIPDSAQMFDADGSLMDAFLEGTPVYICYREETGGYGLSQLRTKTGSTPWLPFPNQMMTLIQLYLQKLHAGYQELGVTNTRGTAIFPSSRLRNFTPAGWDEFETKGFKRINLDGARIFNTRHSVADKLCNQNITPSTDAIVADSFAAVMGTSTQYLFGERTRPWSMGAYNKGEAGKSRRISIALSEYTSWVFKGKMTGKKRKRGAR